MAINLDFHTLGSLTFTFIDDRNRIIPIDENQNYYLAAKLNEILFISHSYTITNNTITFEVDTYTEPFMNEITKRNTEVQIEMGYNTNGIQEVLLRDYALAQPRVYIEGLDPHKVDFGDYFTKEETLALLSGKVNTDDLSGYYTKGETDDLMNDKADTDSLSAFYTKGESDALLDEKADTEDLSAYFTKDEIIDQLSPKDFLIQSSDLIADMLTVSGGCRYKFTQPKNKIIITEAKVNVDEAEIYAKFDIDYTISGITSALTIGGYSIGYDEAEGVYSYVNRQSWTLTQTDPTAEGTDRVFQTTFTAPDPGYSDTDAWSAWYDTESASWVMRCFFDPAENQWVIINSYTYNDTTTSGYFAKGNPNRKALEAVEWEITSDYSSFLPLGNYNQEGLDYNGEGAPAIRKAFVEQNGGAILYEPELKIPNGFTFIGEPEIEVGKTYAISLYNKLVAISEVGDDAIEIDPFEIEVKDAEVFGYSTSGSFISTGSNDKVSYLTKNTIIPTGTYYWSDIFNISESNSENLWLKIADVDISDTTPYGLHEGQTFNGDAHIYMKDTIIHNSAGAGQKNSKCKNVYLVYDNVTTSSSNYATMGYVDDGDIFVDVKNSHLSAIFHGTTFRNKTNNFHKTHNVYATYTNTDFSISTASNHWHILAGASSKNNTNSASAYSVVNDIFVTLNEGNVFNVQPNGTYQLFCGGYYSDSNNVLGGIINNINLVINGGRYFDLSNEENAEGIFVGPFVSSKSKVQINNLNIEVNGGEITSIFGGGYVQQNGIVDILGDVKITINGGTILNVIGLSTVSTSLWSGTGYVKYHGNIYIYLNGGNVGYIHPGERHANSASYGGGNGKETLLGEGYVIVSGNQNFGTEFQGNILHQAETSEPHNTIIFDNYTGTLTSGSQLMGFRHCIFKENSNVKIESEIINMYPVWEVDLSRRSVYSADLPVLSGFAPSGIDLTVDDHNILSTWIIETTDEFPPSGINVFYNGSSIANINTANTAISGENPFSGWGFTIEDGKLLFKEL